MLNSTLRCPFNTHSPSAVLLADRDDVARDRLVSLHVGFSWCRSIIDAQVIPHKVGAYFCRADIQCLVIRDNGDANGGVLEHVQKVSDVVYISW